MASQMPNRIHVTTGSCSKRYRHARIETIVLYGTPSNLDGRERSAAVRRRKITAAETNTNANRVPMFVRSTTSAMFANAANVATNVPVMIVPTYGVRYFGCTFENSGGSRPSRDIG